VVIVIKEYKLGESDSLKKILRFTQAALMVSLIINAGFTFKTLFVDEDWVTIIPPALDEPMTIARNNPTSDQLEKNGWYISELMQTVTPGSVNDQQQKLMMYVHPSLHGEMQRKLEESKDYIVKNNISQIFERRTAKVNTKNMTVIYLGTLNSFVGDKRLEPREIAFKVSFVWEGHKLYIKEAREVPMNEGTVKQ
jgi:type IV conjugative transfer system protein TraE